MSVSGNESETSPKTKGAKETKLAVNVRPAAVVKRPQTSVMVLAAIKALNEKGGSSIQAIKKYIAATYNVNLQFSSLYIKKYLIKAVAAGELTQTRGKGASGSFKITANYGKKAATKPPKLIKKKTKTDSSAANKSDPPKVVIKKVTAGVVKKPKATTSKVVVKTDGKSSNNSKASGSKAKIKSSKPNETNAKSKKTATSM